MATYSKKIIRILFLHYIPYTFVISTQNLELVRELSCTHTYVKVTIPLDVKDKDVILITTN